MSKTIKKYTRIMVFGTFDMVHKGHQSFFRQARRLALKPYLIVSVARDINVKKIKKRKPQIGEKRRLENLCNLKLADHVVMGARDDYLSHILKYRPDIIALGYDQKAYTKNLKKILTKSGLNVKIKRLKSFKPKIYKSSKIYGNK